MPLVEPADLPARLAPRQRLLGLDLGSKTIGLAVSDPGLVVASPIETIRRTRFTADATALFARVDEFGVGGLVLGLPRNMDGSEGPRCQSTRQFAANLLQKRDIAIALWDERLSTAAVERAMIAEGDVSRARRAEAVDRLAAGYILQGYLDSLRWHG
jgi:putative Holliday junction resolvase